MMREKILSYTPPKDLVKSAELREGPGSAGSYAKVLGRVGGLLAKARGRAGTSCKQDVSRLL